MARQEARAADDPQVIDRDSPAKAQGMTLAEVRAKLDGKTGKRFWKNLDELAETPAFQSCCVEEFPRQARRVGGCGVAAAAS